ncbi:MAG TPA: PAS domain S-box protein, partial [Solirubrobacteraceae bacterium]|nr:PAS domain S-box protein [Solirubrobacteraceae bacterium]
MTQDDVLLEESAEELFEDAPCGYLTCGVDGTILRVNRTFERWTGHDRATLVGTRFRDLLAPAGRIYHETHYVPLLQMQGAVREIALEILRADGTRLPALINSDQRRDDEGRPRVIRTTVFDATDRRAYEQELLRSRRREQEIAQLLQRSLLSGEPPSSAEICVEVVYRAAQHEVGGDWHDAFWLDDEQTAGLVVGDVVGRGLEAAAAMGQLRSAIRALASTGLAPGPLLDALDGFV